MSKRHLGRLLSLALLCGLLAACNQQAARTTGSDPSAGRLEPLPDDLLLDVGVDIFDPGLDNIDREAGTTTPGVRRAEAEYVAHSLARSLQRRGQWGAVRLIPDGQSETDIYVDGEILKSDGRTLELRVSVSDSSGRNWFTRTYEEQVGEYPYDAPSQPGAEPFQALYDRVADDMQRHMRGLSLDEMRALRTISALRFAGRFAPDAFSEHLETDGRGRYTIKRLPAENDPILEQVRRIRLRDQMFVDTLQEFYTSFATRMRDPYDQWRRESYIETQAREQLQAEATARKIGGALAVLAGILAQGSDSRVTRSAGAVGIGAGAYLFKSGLDKSAEARIHAEALKELAESLDADIAPHQIALADRTVTLTGTVQEQYQQWREILREMYVTETGQQPATALSH